MPDWTWALRMLRRLVHQIDECTRINDRYLASRMLRDSRLPAHWQARVFWRADGEFCPEQIEHHLCQMFGLYHEMEIEQLSQPPRAHPKPPPQRLSEPESQPAGVVGRQPAGWQPSRRVHCTVLD